MSNPAIAILRETVDDWQYDPWGAGMAAGFAVCNVLYAAGGEIPAEMEYRPAMGASSDLAAIAAEDEHQRDTGENAAGVDWVTSNLASSLIDGAVTVHDLEGAAAILHRFLTFAQRAGRDY